MDWTLIPFGLAVGILVGLTGTGGGSVMTPLLVVVFNINITTAIGTDIAYSAVEKTVGAARQFKAGTVDVGLSTQMALGSVPGAIVGVITLKKLEASLGGSFDTVIFSLLAGALLLTGTALLARILVIPRLNDRERETVELTTRERWSASLLGVFVGLVLGLTSAGSGSLIAVGLILVFRLVPRRVVGTDLFHASIVLWVAAIAHVFAGDIDYGLAGTLLIGAIPGIWFASRLSLHAPVGALRLGLAVVLLGAGLGMLKKAGLDVPAAVMIAAPVITIAVIGGAALRQLALGRREGEDEREADDRTPAARRPVAVGSTSRA